MLLKQPLRFRVRRIGRFLLPVIVNWLSLLLLLTLLLSQTGCATNCPEPTPVSPTLPTPPSVSTPLPQTPYSQTWSEKVRGWRGRLTATHLMSEPSLKPGQP